MTLAASSSPRAATGPAPVGNPWLTSPWVWLGATLAALTGLLAALPGNVAEPLQTGLGWLILGTVAVLGVVLVARGLACLLDCDNS